MNHILRTHCGVALWVAGASGQSRFWRRVRFGLVSAAGGVLAAWAILAIMEALQ